MHRNLWANLLYASLQAASSSLTLGAFFSNYIVYGLHQSDSTVGFIFCVGGLVMVILALPLGYITDKMSKERLLKIGTLSGLVTVVSQSMALQYGNLVLLYVAAGLNGLTQAITGPALAANFADSIKTGQRTTLYTLQYSGSLAMGALGPLLAIVFFYFQGNTWELASLTLVMHVGNGIAAVAYLLLLLIRDKDALGDESEGVLGGGDSAAAAPSDPGDGGDTAAPLLAGEEEQEQEEEVTPGLGLGHQTLRLPCCTLRVKHIPYLLFGSDITIALGAGATVAFFPLYFSQELSISPMGLSGIFASVPVLVALAGGLLIPISKVIGRAPAAVLANTLGTAALFSLALVKTPWVAILTYLLRTAFMNASYAIQRGILMDCVSKEKRGRWSSLANLTTATWAGSSLVGGLLVERFSFQDVFLGTASLYVVGLLVLSPVIFLTAGERVDKGEGGSGGGGKRAVGEGEEVDGGEVGGIQSINE